MVDNLWRKTTIDGRQPLMEDDLWWKMTSVGRWPLWMTTCDGRFLQSNGFGPSFWGRLNVWCRIHFWRMTSTEDDPCWRTTFDGSPYFCQCLSFQVTSKQWFRSILAGEKILHIFLSKRLSQRNWRRFGRWPLRKTTLVGRQPLTVHLTFLSVCRFRLLQMMGLVYLSRWG